MYTEISYEDYQEKLKDDTMYCITDYPQDKEEINMSKLFMNGIEISGMRNDVGVSKEKFEDEINKIKQMLNSKVTLIHNCQNCGATLNLEENKPIFHCKYCGSTYVIGTQRLMQTY